MRVPAVRLPLIILALTCATLAGTPGIFEGRVHRDGHGSTGWIYVQGRNGTLRRVEISRARVLYADSVPKGERAGDAAEDLVSGAEVRITAEQDGAGEWRASRIEILKLSRSRRATTSRMTSRKW